MNNEQIKENVFTFKTSYLQNISNVVIKNQALLKIWITCEKQMN